MSHFPELVVGDEVEGQRAPHDDELKLEGKHVYLGVEEREHVAKEYGVADSADLPALLPHVEDWTRAEAGTDDKGIYFIRAYNPNAKWDWYELGARWSGFGGWRRCRRGSRAWKCATVRHGSSCFDPASPLPCGTGTPLTIGTTPTWMLPTDPSACACAR